MKLVMTGQSENVKEVWDLMMDVESHFRTVFGMSSEEKEFWLKQAQQGREKLISLREEN